MTDVAMTLRNETNSRTALNFSLWRNSGIYLEEFSKQAEHSIYESCLKKKITPFTCLFYGCNYRLMVIMDDWRCQKHNKQINERMLFILVIK